MTGELLLTKLYVPPLRPNLVRRPHLVGKLNAGLESKLILVSAPAGFGKTTLLTTWLGQWDDGRGAPRPHIAWISLDEGDNDLVRFLTYFVRALQGGDEDLGKTALVALQTRHEAAAEPLLTPLLNEIGASRDQFIVILDDFHAITNQQVHQAVTFLCDHLPPSMRLVISSRADPPWPLARLRARGDMAELRANDLRFTLEETTSFLNEKAKLGLSPDQIGSLDARTEGWITGLQMVALSMRQREDRTGFIIAFTGSHRFVLDYLVEEVLDRQPPSIQQFLLQSSILDRLTAPLCDAVTGRDDSQAILSLLDQANLFLIPLDDERRWFRYHHLFADLLRSRLNQTEPELVFPLHLKASEWYEQNGLIAESVDHALAASDIERVARLVERNALALMGYGELTALVETLDALPGLDERSQPWLTFVRAWALAYSGRLDDAALLLEEIERSTASWEEESDLQRLTSRITSLRAYIAELNGDMTAAIHYANEALEQLPQEELTLRSYVASLLGANLRENGQLENAAQAFAEAASMSQAAGDIHVAVMVRCRLASLELIRGQYRKAAVTCRDALQLAGDYARQSGRQLPVTGYAHLRMGQLLLEWNDLEASLYHAREGVRLSKQWGQADILGAGYFYLSSVLLARGDCEGAMELIHDLNQAWAALPPWFGATSAAHEIQVRLAQGDLSGAELVSRRSGLDVDDPFQFRDEFVYRALALLRISQGQIDEALALLDRLLSVTESAMATGSVIKILVLKAIALVSREALASALIPFERALALGEPEGCVRSFIDQGALVAKLLQEAQTRRIAPRYAGELLAALGKDDLRDDGTISLARAPASAPLDRPTPLPIDPLSERETQILRLLATPLSAVEIAEELFIAPSTVRSHVKNIYSKLNVHRRAEAVVRAQELRLLEVR
jgi:LuxR family maltose regulon positive regulatory protein